MDSLRRASLWRGFGWDINTAFSRPRGSIFPIGSFGHNRLYRNDAWMDPQSDTYVVLLANAIHPRGNPPISALRGQVCDSGRPGTSSLQRFTLTLRNLCFLQEARGWTMRRNVVVTVHPVQSANPCRPART